MILLSVCNRAVKVGDSKNKIDFSIDHLPETKINNESIY